MSLKEKYEKEVKNKMMEIFGYKNPLSCPKIEKVIVNTSFGKLLANFKPENHQKVIQEIERDLSLITGQKPLITFAKKSIAGFKVRKGQPVGAKVTLRRQRMFDFLEKLFFIALPRSRDFRGIEKSSIDKNGNLTVGVKEHSVFPEISLDKTNIIFGLEATIVTTAKKREEAETLFKLLGFPIKS
jgi:large subunit ribosomal protein L5